MSTSSGFVGLSGLKDALLGAPLLTRLDLSGYKLNDAGQLAICEIVKANPVLQALNLSSTNPYLVELFGAALESNTVLRELDLSHSGLDSFGLCTIASSLKNNTTLTLLDVSDNWLPDDPDARSVASFAVMLKYNTTLTDVAAARCRLGPRGFGFIAAAVSSNTTLVRVDLRENTHWLERESFVALLGNQTLTALHDTSTTFNGSDFEQRERRAAISRLLATQHALRLMEGGSNQLTREWRSRLGLADHYRVPHIRFLVRTRVMCQDGRARAAGSLASSAAWLCARAPLWVVVHVAALLRDWLDAGGEPLDY